MAGQTIGANINEIWLGYLLNGNSFPPGSEGTYNSSANQLTPQEVNNQKGRAEAQRDIFLQYLYTNNLGSPTAAYWTARPGTITSIVGYEVDQDKNPTDVLVALTTGRFYGISAKSTQAGGTGFKNPGLGTIEKSLFIRQTPFSDAIENKLQEVKNAYSDLNLENAIDRKAVLENINNRQMKDDVYRDYGDPLYNELRTILFNRMRQMDPWEYNQFLGSELMNEDEETMRLPYVKITGSGGSGTNFTARLYDPIRDSIARKIAQNGATFRIASGSQNLVEIHSQGQKQFTMRFKWSSTYFGSSMKFEAK